MGDVEAKMERLFARQLARATGPDGGVDIRALARMVRSSYEEAERDRLRTDRAMDLMAEELEGANVELERLLQDISVQNLRFEAALGNMPHGLAMLDAAERVLVVNARLGEMLGLPDGAVVPGTTLAEMVAAACAHGFCPGQEAEEATRDIRRSLLSGSAAEIERMAGRRMLLLSSRRMEGSGCVLLVQDITERRAQEARIAHLAQHDVLTGLPNRASFLARIDQALARAQRGEGFALLCLDLDRFKQVNDTLGHPIGDLLLTEVTARLRATLRETDMVARLGGDEFAIIQDLRRQPPDTVALARRIVEVVSAPYLINGHRIVVGTSIGIALAPADGAAADTLLKAADLALYRAKADGRGAWRFFEPAMDARMQERRATEIALRDALEHRNFTLLYQPLLDVGTLRVSGFEALLRWRQPDGTLSLPATFIPLAEETGLIVQIGDWVLREACRAALAWPGQMSVAVNVSSVQFRQPRFVDQVRDALAESGLAPSRLELEVTETIMLQDSAVVVAQLNRLRALGVRIAMDDFGTGYSSLSYLRSFPFDTIKIDRSFVRDLDARGDARAIVGAIVGLGQSLGMRTTAEGVETEAELAGLRRVGCTDAQGFLFSHPIPPEDVPDFLASTASAFPAAAE
ncbi:EAL domain-containing protein [Roseomonas sp. PWR1]|uniref:EAL domain-containing protein n=1 Tax=Roseomonas nitratireducens TaxID=2820810 RepID=A0ABS4ALZ2_9PROT|nr:EAL domain-containing protein [Neoroseomonas nitratireducens]MBP0462375.1 EAL domain-containing protein [Neoroseomonas nitratireducens]